MKRYLVKPEEVQAAQWHKDDPPLPGMYMVPGDTSGLYVIKTDQGEQPFVLDGDWIVKDSCGWYSVETPKAFERIYEPVERP